MRKIKKIAAVLLAAAMMLSTVACSGGDKSWAVKSGDKTVPIGVYIYCLFSAYSSASNKVSDTSKPVLQQQVEGKDALQWIRENAMEQVKTALVIENKMKEMKLSLTADEKTQADKTISSMWTQYGSALEGYGISQTSFTYAVTQLNINYQKVLSAYYGKDGPSPVSDDELHQYFESNYTDFSYLMNAYQNKEANSSGSYAMTDEQKAAAKAALEDYAAKITAGKMTPAEAEKAYQSSDFGTTDSKLTTDTAILANSSYPADVVNALKDMKNGEAKALEITISSQKVCLLLVKNDITAKTESQFSTESGKFSVLSSMKAEEFKGIVDKEVKALSNVQVNQSAIDSQNPSRFAS